MITNITNQLQYEDLFKRAWDELHYRDAFSEEQLKEYASQDNTFNSLEDYFTCIGDLIKPTQAVYPREIHSWNGSAMITTPNPLYDGVVDDIPIQPNYEFIMLPIDEPRFEINANTRDIMIPAGFKKLVGVQGDHVAETLIFSIDRFIDYKDLLPSNINQMKICIQWVDENGKDIITPIQMIHYEPETQKILFGWPLSSQLTKAARNINFSVRFIVIKDDKVEYSLNTKTHQITIVPALQPTLNADIAIDEAANSFIDAIVNSPSSSEPPAIDPSFEAPGLDLPETKDIGDNAGELKVQAILKGTGHINYTKWTHNGKSITNGVKERYEKISPKPTSRNENEKYYIENSNPANTFELYTGVIDGMQPDLYERYFVYEIPVSKKDITGTYVAYAQNRTTKNLSAEKSSTTCTIPGPSEIQYEANGDLSESAVPVENSDNVVLQVKVSAAAGDTIEYKWRYSLTDPELSGASEISNPSAAYTISDLAANAGYYQVIATPKRNRATGESLLSTICRVTGRPAAPTLAEFPIAPRETEQDITDRQTIALTANVEPIIGTHLSDEFIYEWYGKIADGTNQEWIQITSDNAKTYRADSGNNSYNSNILNVYGSAAEDDGIMYKYIVYNKLNGVKSTGTPLPEDNYITIM